MCMMCVTRRTCVNVCGNVRTDLLRHVDAEHKPTHGAEGLCLGGNAGPRAGGLSPDSGHLCATVCDLPWGSDVILGPLSGLPGNHGAWLEEGSLSPPGGPG